jgi:CheY-like chemotaxis protein
LIKQYLKKLPYDLDEADNGEVALRKFILGRYDLVLMDMRMPVMDGYTAVRKIRHWEREHECAPTAIIALTASALETDVQDCLAAGCTAHLSKPVKKTNLVAAIRKLTDRPSSDARDSAPEPMPIADSTHAQQS